MLANSKPIRYAVGFVIGIIVFIGIPEAARWMNGGAFAQGTPSAVMPLPAPNKTEGGNCNLPGGTNNGSVNCGNTTNNFNPD